MKKIIIILLAMLPFAVLAQNVKTLKPDKHKVPEQLKVETKMMVIKGENAWLNTGFILSPSDEVTIKATGEVSFSPEAGSKVGPNGYKRSYYEMHYIDDFSQCADPLEVSDIGHAALIAKDHNGMFGVGTSSTFTNKTGALYIGINDCTFKGGAFSNSGQFNVSIKVVHPKLKKK